MTITVHQSRFFTLVAAISLFVGSAVFVNAQSTESEMVSFNELTEADIDVILAVKAEMETARLQQLQK